MGWSESIFSMQAKLNNLLRNIVVGIPMNCRIIHTRSIKWGETRERLQELYYLPEHG